MALNRLRLNWDLNSRDERNQFVHEYLKTLTFQNFTDHELETLSNYILWGKNKEGLNGRQEGLDLETVHKTWDAQQDESFDALLESPTFSESMLRRPSDPVYKIARPKFSRSEARKNAPPHILEALESIWKQLDSIELLLNFYDLEHGRRKNPPREVLLKRFQEEEIQRVKGRAQKLGLSTYLKLRHELVELRREQYTLRDSYAPVMLSLGTFDTFGHEENMDKGLDFEVLPLGLGNTPLGEKLFKDEYPIPSEFDEKELKQISDLIWRPAPSTPSSTSSSTSSSTPSQTYFDFRDTNHLYKLANLLSDGEDSELFTEIKKLFFIYANLAKLKPMHQLILDMKLKQNTNQEIVDEVFKQFGHKYTSNYISTIYCKNILPNIARAASNHLMVCQNLFFPENFKTCLDCGRTLLRNEENFMRKAKVKDGFSPRCKACEKLKRDAKK